MQSTREQIYEIGLANDDNVLSDEQLKNMFKTFVDTFRIGTEYIYRVELAKEDKTLRVIVEHLGMFDKKLFQAVLSRPLHYIDLFRSAINDASLTTIEREIEMVSQSTIIPIRKLDAEHLNRISTVRGIVLSVSSIATRSISLYVFCKTCMNSKMVNEAIPKKCESCSGTDTFIAIPEKSILQDSQMIKVQEVFEDLPTGDIPRHLMAMATGGLVDRVVPGSTVTITGVYMIGHTKQATPFIRIFGMDTNTGAAGIQPMHRPLKKAMTSHAPIPRQTIIKSIAPEVFGHKDIKLALACALFSGVRRSFGDGITVRGDINVLLLGDPGIAKSQMLKFLANVSTRGVYTSGKGASAAGLTASVCKDRMGQFYLEGGALVLADGGLCCIDEFDKMQERDRVAIHEAMEQQTISISKAGIVTSLNSRCAVVAAANPIFGRYDESKAPGENIDFGVTILSRFDLVFVIRDNLISDKQIAWHVLTRSTRQAHTESTQSEVEIEEQDHLSAEALRDYAAYARTINPEIEEDASQRLQAFYIQTRKTARECKDSKKAPIPITVRQLEAITRISEALARMELETVVTTEHVEEAIRLFTESTMKAVIMGHFVEGMPRKEWTKEYTAAETAIRRALPVGVSKSYSALVNELCRQHSEGVVTKCIEGLVRGEKLSLLNGGRLIVRMP
ncbi:DNA replication licensing factor MCM5 [Nematocida homosporus]|uniref:DNA replication licensing factor MCM5 n=1 Tax=Nematocida homosporus TaxID=1912981 RepID=UPI00221FB4DE|nr:DNA replication licensing factor MCM5 [Nematocida homosporus]KAI5186824.1 DNA replication licensing factor MCM5 [Nematocida homosporus]